MVYNVGLCICLYDIIKLEDSYIFPGDGASHTKGDLPCWFFVVAVLVLHLLYCIPVHGIVNQ